ncbi:hypothetical protein KI387_017588 [Taxus chinensis]|uniref:Aminotransferase-like plant mobile domain-containing protein n=1 Tax=Taxus chinensis TaxID=29808 RepID=A0AA38GJJ0_TAXCH|nr:hypothetical protein KI387_017588 [Taxus chinensis]
MMGTLIEYSSDGGLIRAACSALFDVDDIPHDRMTVALHECISDPTLHRGPLYIMALINGFLLTDKIGTSFLRGLLPLVHGIYSGDRYCWGQCILAHLYWDLHLITYHSQKTVGPTSLLQIWSWDHITIGHPVGPFRVRDPEEPSYMAWVAAGGDVQGHLGSLFRYRPEFDELVAIDVIWRPYRHFQWPEDATEFSVCLVEHFMIGSRSYIMELYRVDRCQRKLGRVQGVPQPDIWYAHRDSKRQTFGPRIVAARARASFT